MTPAGEGGAGGPGSGPGGRSGARAEPPLGLPRSPPHSALRAACGLCSPRGLRPPTGQEGHRAGSRGRGGGDGAALLPGVLGRGGLGRAEAALGDCLPGRSGTAEAALPRGEGPRLTATDGGRPRRPWGEDGERRGPPGARTWKAHGLRGWGSFT